MGHNPVEPFTARILFFDRGSSAYNIDVAPYKLAHSKTRERSDPLPSQLAGANPHKCVRRESIYVLLFVAVQCHSMQSDVASIVEVQHNPTQEPLFATLLLDLGKVMVGGEKGVLWQL